MPVHRALKTDSGALGTGQSQALVWSKGDLVTAGQWPALKTSSELVCATPESYHHVPARTEACKQGSEQRGFALTPPKQQINEQRQLTADAIHRSQLPLPLTPTTSQELSFLLSKRIRHKPPL